MEPLHEDLIDYESARATLGDAAMDGPTGPVLDWPDGWDAASLVAHRSIVAAHLAACRADAIRKAREGT